MKKLFSLIFLTAVFANSEVCGNHFYKSWNEGILVLKNQQTLKGEITYNLKI
jgi:hypothetical protein